MVKDRSDRLNCLHPDENCGFDYDAGINYERATRPGEKRHAEDEAKSLVSYPGANDNNSLTACGINTENLGRFVFHTD